MSENVWDKFCKFIGIDDTPAPTPLPKKPTLKPKPKPKPVKKAPKQKKYAPMTRRRAFRMKEQI